MSQYQQPIEATARQLGHATVDARRVEAWMRLEHGCLDHLGGRRWVEAVRIAIACADAAERHLNEELVRSYGLCEHR